MSTKEERISCTRRASLGMSYRRIIYVKNLRKCEEKLIIINLQRLQYVLTETSEVMYSLEVVIYSNTWYMYKREIDLQFCFDKNKDKSRIFGRKETKWLPQSGNIFHKY